MTEITHRTPRHLRWVLELLLSSYVTGPALSLYLFKLDGSLLLILASHLARADSPHVVIRTDIDYETQLAFDIMWGAAAGITFVFLRLLSYSSSSQIVLRRFGGYVAISWFPLYWLFTPKYITALPALSGMIALLLSSELLGVGVCVYYYGKRKWPFSQRSSIFFLSLHFALWLFLAEPWGHFLFINHMYQYWVTWTQGGVLYMLLGFCSSVAWGFYINDHAAIVQPRSVHFCP